VWVKALITAKRHIERLYKKQERPWYAQISQDGQITLCRTFDCG
jgi:hypothetical protein